MARARNVRRKRASSPTIDDVAAEIRRIFIDHARHVTITLEVLSYSPDEPVYRASCRCRGTNTLLGSAQFGSGSIGGFRTYEGAALCALFYAEDVLQRGLNDGLAT